MRSDTVSISPFFLKVVTVKTGLYVSIMSRTLFRGDLHSIVNVKERLARNRGGISSLSDSNGIRTHSYLVRIVKAAIECRLSLKRVRDMIITYSQVQRTDKHLQHSSIIWPVTLNG